MSVLALPTRQLSKSCALLHVRVRTGTEGVFNTQPYDIYILLRNTVCNAIQSLSCVMAALMRRCARTIAARRAQSPKMRRGAPQRTGGGCTSSSSNALSSRTRSATANNHSSYSGRIITETALLRWSDIAHSRYICAARRALVQRRIPYFSRRQYQTLSAVELSFLKLSENHVCAAPRKPLFVVSNSWSTQSILVSAHE